MSKNCNELDGTFPKIYDDIFENYPYELSDFQKYSIQAITEGYNSLVTAGTGSGKTLSAEYAIEYFNKKGLKTIYTSPIKALSNQKYHEFNKKNEKRLLKIEKELKLLDQIDDAHGRLKHDCSPGDHDPTGYDHYNGLISSNGYEGNLESWKRCSKNIEKLKKEKKEILENPISYGLITGDIKEGPNADCIIMTCEILRNHLFNMKYQNEESRTHFEMDFENELGCVIFDEVHYINDKERGTVWEEAIMALPKHVQLVMLSATMSRPTVFSEWVSKTTGRDVWLSGTKQRVVPLKHCSFLPFSEHNRNCIINNAITDHDKETKNLLLKFNKPMLIKDENGFNDKTYHNVARVLDYIEKNNKKGRGSVRVNKTFVINEMVNHLKQSKLTPAIFFSLSRKNVEYFASLVETVLHDEGSTKSSTAEQECKQILMKLPNWKEYVEMPEFTTLVTLLQKGIAFHHSGMISVYREMVELMFDKGYVQLLFATETFAVGINLPTKSVVFDSFRKYDGSQHRTLMSHEYTQMAGRAGRRGIDTVGHVFHLNSLSKLPSISEYREMLNSSPLAFRSRFKLDFNLIMRLIKVDTKDYSGFVTDSFYQKEILGDIKMVEKELSDIKKKYEQSKSFIKRTPEDVLKKYMDISKDLQMTKNKKKVKTMKRELNNIEDFNKTVKDEYRKYESSKDLAGKVNLVENKLQRTKDHVENYIKLILQILSKNGFVRDIVQPGRGYSIDSGGYNSGDDDYRNYVSSSERHDYVLTEKGIIASQIQEAHSLALTEIIPDLVNYEPHEIVSILSTFTEVSIPDDDKIHMNRVPESILQILQKTKDTYDKYQDIELENRISSSYSYRLQYDTCGFMMDWCQSVDEQQCKYIIQEAFKCGIYLGSFTKSILKINNLVREIQGSLGEDSIELKNKLSKVEELTLKFMITNQSLYV
jgi:superfamily II RNA helicase